MSSGIQIPVRTGLDFRQGSDPKKRKLMKCTNEGNLELDQGHCDRTDRRGTCPAVYFQQLYCQWRIDDADASERQPADRQQA